MSNETPEKFPRHDDPTTPVAAGPVRGLEITEQQLRELSAGGNTLRQMTREHLELIIDTAAAGVVAIDMETGRYEISSGVLKLLGYSPDQLSQVDFRMSQMIHPEDAEKTIAARNEAMANGHLFERSYRLRRRDGSYVWVMGTGKAALDANGQPRFFAGVIRDISFSKRIEADLRAGEARYRAMFAASPMPMWVIGQDGATILEANEAAHELYGVSVGALSGKPVNAFVVGKHVSRFNKLCSPSLGNKVRTGSMQHRRDDGSLIEVECQISPTESSTELAYIVLINDMTERRAAQAEIKRLATLDPLTQLPNRRMLIQRLDQLIARAHAEHTVGAVLHVDLDQFKAINETLTHDQADQIIVETARRLLNSIREEDTVARLAGDEFIVVMHDLPGRPDRAAAIAESSAKRLLEAIRQPYQVNGTDFLLTASMGLVELDRHCKTAEELLQHANSAVHQAKSLGRNQVRFFDSALQAVVHRRASLEIDLRRALRESQFELYYQIQVDQELIATGAEVLLRWIHPERGMVSPLEFIALAEESGVIVPLGTWVLNQACERLAKWAHMPGYEKLHLSVNVSARQFHQPDFVRELTVALQRTGARADMLTLELTESALLEHAEEAIEKMNEIRRLGCGFSLDDFGTGYSSLSYLKRLPIDELKIDRTFTRDILTDPNDAVIVKTIIGMAKNLGLELIVEGVETSEQQALLTQWGCKGFQGFLHGKPVPVSDFEPRGEVTVSNEQAFF
ncbi:MAG: putative bifunctional diguanylate cyclase/phosphodiesterase [Burkholderiaceae bacterium]